MSHDKALYKSTGTLVYLSGLCSTQCFNTDGWLTARTSDWPISTSFHQYREILLLNRWRRETWGRTNWPRFTWKTHLYLWNAWRCPYVRSSQIIILDDNVNVGLYLCHSAFDIRPERPVADHLLSSNKIIRVQRKAVMRMGAAIIASAVGAARDVIMRMGAATS